MVAPPETDVARPRERESVSSRDASLRLCLAREARQSSKSPPAPSGLPFQKSEKKREMDHPRRRRGHSAGH